MSLADWIKARVAALETAARPWAERSRLNGFIFEFLMFGLKQAWACLFGAMMLGLLLVTRYVYPADAPLARYDFLVLAAVAIQVLLLALKLEHPDEAVVIFAFHVVGTAMEVFKTAHGSWIYPEASVLRIGGAPLFSGFMYACVGSYIARAWRIFDFRFIRYPPVWAAWTMALLAYANFFTHHFMPDIRWGLFVFCVVIFGPAWIVYTPDEKPRRMPMLLAGVLAAFFIWIAENLGTFAQAWIYPAQRDGWSMVSFAKLGSWYLLINLSFVLVTLVRRPRAPAAAGAQGVANAVAEPAA
ncbi:MAG: DUF817 domain-containing protein [Phenylobacterium sp.]|uniref:DUF817 domain-containing protein n=1 Tax=Phenylobacterium sp. TaxID=1871053 RepID=UPI003918BCAD